MPHRRDRLLQERVHDPYRMRAKPGGPLACPRCGAVFMAGLWHWRARPEDAAEDLCPACRRIEDACPAGFVRIEGPFVAEHKDEILALCRRVEGLETGEHPMNRVMEVVDRDGGLVVTTTDIHLPRRIGEALEHAYHGKLSFHYDKGTALLRVLWRH